MALKFPMIPQMPTAGRHTLSNQKKAYFSLPSGFKLLIIINKNLRIEDFPNTNMSNKGKKK